MAIKGILTFKPLKTGGVSILIDGKTEDVPALAALYGKEVVIYPVDQAPDMDREALHKEILHRLEWLKDFVVSETAEPQEEASSV